METNQHFPNIRIAILDVGQGDTIVVSSPDTHEAIVVDCINADAVIDYLTQEQIMYLRGILITHLHADHYNEVDYLLERCNCVPGMSECEKVGFNMIANKRDYERLKLDDDKHSAPLEESSQKRRSSSHNTLQNIRRWVGKDKSKFIVPLVQGSPLPIPFSGLLAETTYLLHPYAFDIPELEAKGLNNTSAVLRIVGPNVSALLTGDIEPEGWRMLKCNYAHLRSDILKFPHHGGAWKNSDIDDLLDTVNPSIVIISVGSEGYEKYTHPHPDIFNALARRPTIRVLCTQATSQCQNDLSASKSIILEQLETQANKYGKEVIGSRRGCPCAGTIVIELSDTLKIIQPELLFHRNSIITPYRKQHRCNI